MNPTYLLLIAREAFEHRHALDILSGQNLASCSSVWWEKVRSIQLSQMQV